MILPPRLKRAQGRKGPRRRRRSNHRQHGPWL